MEKVMFKWLRYILDFLRNRIWGKKTTTTSTPVEIPIRPIQHNKKAVCIGINDYPGHRNDLKGCVNDAQGWYHILQKTFGFTTPSLLLNSQAKKATVLKELNHLVDKAKVGDVLAITFSGHGTAKPDWSSNEADEPDSKDEAWCLYDGLLLDDDIRSIIKRLQEGVRLIVISDSCHSGTVTRAFLKSVGMEVYAKPRYMPPEDIAEANLLGGLKIKKRLFYSEENMKEILISGCKATEYSYDAKFNGKPMGALSHYALTVLKANPNMTYHQFYKNLRKSLPSRIHPQTPQLEGSESNKKRRVFE